MAAATLLRHGRVAASATFANPAAARSCRNALPVGFDAELDANDREVMPLRTSCVGSTFTWETWMSPRGSSRWMAPRSTARRASFEAGRVGRRWDGSTLRPTAVTRSRCCGPRSAYLPCNTRRFGSSGGPARACGAAPSAAALRERGVCGRAPETFRARCARAASERCCWRCPPLLAARRTVSVAAAVV